jgi:hypothetical protein
MRRAGVALALAGLVLAALGLAGPSIAADPSVVFEKPAVEVRFPDSATWTEAFSSRLSPSRVELLNRLEGGDAWFVRDATFQKIGQAANGDGQYSVRLVDQGTALPNTVLRYHFRVTVAPGAVVDGPEGVVRIVDDRVDWQTLQGDIVRLHWHIGDAAFARRALRIAEDAISSTSKLLGVTETEPIDFFVYGDSDLFRTALPGTKEFVAGRAVREIRTLFALIRPDQIGSDWVQVVIPHELTHLVFDTATLNPYHVPPHWLNEGLATYLSEGYTAADRQRVTNAVQDGTLLPLQAIAGGFPAARQDLFYLGYAEGTSAIDFFIRRFGEPKLVELIRSYATGVTDDEAFRAATGLDMAGFVDAWLKDNDAEAPATLGPVAALPGPTPPSWADGASSSSAPGETPPPGASPSPSPGTSTGSLSDELLAGALAGLAIGVMLVGLLLWAVGRRRSAPESPIPGPPAPPTEPAS